MQRLASTFDTSGMSKSLNSTRDKSSASLPCAGSISAQWNGALTFKGTARFAPRAFNKGIARSTAAALPAMTTCPG